MKTITAIWSTPSKNHSIVNRVVAQLIRWYQGTPYSHICVKDGDIIYESNGKGVQQVCYSEWRKIHEIVYQKDAHLTKKRHDILVKMVRMYMGTPYAYATLIAYPILELWHVLTKGRIDWEFAQDEDNTLHCAEFVFLLFEKELRTKISGPQELITSEDIYNALHQC